MTSQVTHPCGGCAHLQKSWRRGNAVVVRWVCGRYKVVASVRCIDYKGKVNGSQKGA